MHVLPPRELDGTTCGILPVSGAIWMAMGGGILGLPFLPILARGAWFAAGWGGRPVKAAIAFEAHQCPFDWQGAALAPQPGRVVAATS